MYQVDASVPSVCLFVCHVKKQSCAREWGSHLVDLKKESAYMWDKGGVSSFQKTCLRHIHLFEYKAVTKVQADLTSNTLIHDIHGIHDLHDIYSRTPRPVRRLHEPKRI